MVALEAGLEALKGEKRAQDASVTALQQEMAHISQQASARGALDAFRKDRRSKEEAYQNECVTGLSCCTGTSLIQTLYGRVLCVEVSRVVPL